jgi:hypothetical protein
VPDLPSVDNIEQVVVLGPQRGEPRFHQAGLKRAIENGDQRLIATELAIVGRILKNTIVKVMHGGNDSDKTLLKIRKSRQLNFSASSLNRKVKSGRSAGASFVVYANNPDAGLGKKIFKNVSA